MNYDAIRARHRAVRDGYPPDLNLRLHRVKVPRTVCASQSVGAQF
jgi:hypothetical protein